LMLFLLTGTLCYIIQAKIFNFARWVLINEK
jgi:hypothetical protein